MSALLAECGEALYGSRWQTELARDLGVSDRTVRRWAAGEQPMSPSACADLLRLAQERASLLDSLAGRLRELG
jgi:methylphosphotriester-DNA--protein-cysteine methyltransferase